MYEAKDYSHLLGTEGFSDTLLNNHFKLYQGYVTNSNKVLEEIGKHEPGTPEHSELTRRFGWEFNGMRLHELYFENMAKDNKHEFAKDTLLLKLIDEQFGSNEACHKDFTDKAKLRGIGWMVMYYDPRGKRIFNTWIGEHAENHLAGCTPLVVMDMWEHAFMVDYGLDKSAYIGAFVKALDWNVAEERFNAVQK